MGDGWKVIKAIVLILITAAALGILVFATLALVGLDWRWLGQAQCE
jgi:hypothetical protein